MKSTWTVTTSSGHTKDIRAVSCNVTERGILVFYDKSNLVTEGGRILHVFADKQWTEVELKKAEKGK